MSKMTTEKLYKEKKDCCGCEICAQTCPKQIIAMQCDAEGFFYPKIIQNSSCIECNMCQQVCPVRHVNEIHSSFLYAYAGWDTELGQIVSSSSGGAASALSRFFIKNNGIIYGAAYENSFRSIGYRRVSKEDEINSLKGSKYVQASKDGLLESIKSDLANRKKVLFIGLPCDCAAIKRVLGNSNALYVTSLVCHGPTSPKVHEQYCNVLEAEHGSPINDFSVRYKKEGKWKPYYIYASFEDGTQHLEEFEKSSYNKAFLFLKRPSCNACVFKVDKYVSDLLIGDFHAAKIGTETYNESGVSSILVLTERGQEMMEGIAGNFFFREVEKSTSTHQLAINRAVKARVNRSHFSSVLRKKGLAAAAELPSVSFFLIVDQIMLRIKKTGVKIKRIIG